jgi:hypothetical protein
MKDSKQELFDQLIAPLYFYMQLSRRAYAKYLNNKILLHALNIFSANQKIVALLEQNPALLPDELMADAIELLNHYGIWMNQFVEFRAAGSHQLKDEFIFHHIDDQSAYPRESEQRFLTFYEQLKKERSNG